MNNIEFNAILYYADYLSLKLECKPVTDNCKYFFIKGSPINSSFVLDYELSYDNTNRYYLLAQEEYGKIKDKFGEDCAASFIDNICYLSARGVVDAELMLEYIYRYSPKYERRKAYKKYYNWKNDQKYTHKITNDRGDIEERECSRFVYNAEKYLERLKLQESIGDNVETAAETIEINK